jgi:hypothetical protein
MVAKNTITRSDSESAQHLNAFEKMLRVPKVTRFELCKLESLLELHDNRFKTKYTFYTQTTRQYKIETASARNIVFLPWKPNSTRCRRWRSMQVEVEWLLMSLMASSKKMGQINNWNMISQHGRSNLPHKPTTKVNNQINTLLMCEWLSYLNVLSR